MLNKPVRGGTWKDIARALTGKMNDKARKVESVGAFLSQITQGRRSVPATWEAHILSAMGYASRDEIRKDYPRIHFHNESWDPSDLVYGFELKIKKVDGEIEHGNLAELARLLKALKKFGIVIAFELHIK